MNYIVHGILHNMHYTIVYFIVLYYNIMYSAKKGAVSLILGINRRLWTCKGPNCHVKKYISAGENESLLTEGPHDRTRELTRGSVTS